MTYDFIHKFDQDDTGFEVYNILHCAIKKIKLTDNVRGEKWHLPIVEILEVGITTDRDNKRLTMVLCAPYKMD